MDPQRLQNLRPLVVEIVRASADAQASGDAAAVATLIRRRTTGWTKREKLRLTATLAWTAGLLATQLHDEKLGELLELLGKPDEQLAAVATAELLTQLVSL